MSSRHHRAYEIPIGDGFDIGSSMSNHTNVRPGAASPGEWSLWGFVKRHRFFMAGGLLVLVLVVCLVLYMRRRGGTASDGVSKRNMPKESGASMLGATGPAEVEGEEAVRDIVHDELHKIQQEIEAEQNPPPPAPRTGPAHATQAVQAHNQPPPHPQSHTRPQAKSSAMETRPGFTPPAPTREIGNAEAASSSSGPPSVSDPSSTSDKLPPQPEHVFSDEAPVVADRKPL